MSSTATRRDLATIRTPFTFDQECRIRHLVACSPSARKPIDSELEALGFIQSYDGADAVELADAATSRGEDGSTVIFERSGRMHPWLVARN